MQDDGQAVVLIQANRGTGSGHHQRFWGGGERVGLLVEFCVGQGVTLLGHRQCGQVLGISWRNARTVRVIGERLAVVVCTPGLWRMRLGQRGV